MESEPPLAAAGKRSSRRVHATWNAAPVCLGRHVLGVKKLLIDFFGLPQKLLPHHRQPADGLITDEDS